MIRRHRKIILPAGILVLALCVAGILKATKPVVEPQTPVEKAWPVAVIPAVVSNISPKRRFFGTVVASREVELRAEVKGRVLEVNNSFVDGGIVKKSDLLASIDPFEYSLQLREREAELVEARSRLTELEAEYESAITILARDKEQVTLRKKDLGRRQSLVKRKNVSEKSFDDAKLALNDARQKVETGFRNTKKFKANIASQQATIRRRLLAIQRARRDLQNARILAPFDGFLTEVKASVGRYVSVGDRLARLIRADGMEVKFQIGTAQFGRLAAGQELIGKPVEVIWQGDEHTIYLATIKRFESIVDPSIGGVSLFAEVTNLNRDSRLRPGAFVEVYLKDQQFKSVIKVPETAYHEGSVYTISEDRLKKIPVSVVSRIDDQLIIYGEFTPGEKIVTTSFNGIGPGLKVTIQQ